MRLLNISPRGVREYHPPNGTSFALVSIYVQKDVRNRLRAVRLRYEDETKRKLSAALSIAERYRIRTAQMAEYGPILEALGGRLELCGGRIAAEEMFWLNVPIAVSAESAGKFVEALTSIGVRYCSFDMEQLPVQ